MNCKLFVLVLSACFSASTSLIAQPHSINSPLDKYVEEASEFSSRARANVYFPNPQSIFNGVQFNFVNVGTGNLTFLRRDMVASGRIPLVLARVYDSSSKGTADFGPGWGLSAAETISPGDGKVHLTTESGSVIDFARNGDNSFRLEKEYPSDYIGLSRTAPDTFKASLRTGFVKEFKLIRGEFRLTKVADRNGNELHLVYEKNLVSKMQNANHWIALTRDKQGRIIVAQDDHGRKVSYAYDDKGRLIEADDLGGHAWRYDYAESGKLKTATDPLLRLNLGVTFDETGRVERVQLPSGVIQYSYDLSGRSTTVIDRKKLTSRFFQNEDGTTTRVVNALGEETAIGVDSSRNVISLARNGSVVETMQYDGQHRLVSRHTTGDSGSVDRRYSYDSATGLLGGIHASSGSNQAFAYDNRGNLSGASLADGEHKFGYSSAGDLTGFASKAVNLKFVADPDGLIASMTDEDGAVTTMQYKAGGELSEAGFPNRSRAKYEYQPSGLRARLVYKDGRRVEYSYDPAGNLTGTKVFNATGKQVNGQTLEMNDSYQLSRWVLFDGTETSFRYDANGNLTEIKKGKSVTSFEYDALDRLTAVVTPDGQRLTYTYQPGERSLIEQYEHAGVLVADLRDTGLTFAGSFNALSSRPLTATFGSVRFSEPLGTFQLANADDSEIVRPQDGIEGALAKLHLFQTSMTQGALRSGFNAPFNSMFIPAEYLTINCCPECYYDGEEWYCPPCGPPPLPNPSISSITPSQVGQGRTSVTVKLEGSFNTNPSVSVGGTGISAGTTSVNSDGSLSVPFTIDKNASIQSYTVTETDDGGSSSIAFSIVCATPQDLTWPPPVSLNDGSLAFNYSDSSSTGDPADLAACTVGETVFYPGSLSPYVWPLPMVASTINPSVRSANGTNTAMPDRNFPPDSFQKPYSEAHFTATQRLWYICPCANNGALTNFIPDFPIDRKVFLDSDNLWKYEIDKQGASNKITLPNQ